jgi:NodT family efflux transporter outer membrane factor (OMF) lipoprotein
LYQVGFDSLWEIDIFGGTRRAIQAADASVGAAEEARRTVLVSLLAEVASTYLDLRSQQQQLAIARQNLQAQRETLSITDAKLKSGFATDLDLSRQAAEVALTAATIPALESAERDAAHTLAFLVGAEPTALVAELAKESQLPPAPPEIPVGVPSDLLRRRPDVRQAERQIAVATAEVGVATADLFPKFDLTAAFGLTSTTAKHLADWPSRYLTVSPAMSWPVLDWGRVRSQIRVQNEMQQQAMLNYENAVAQALKDVEDALVHYQKEQVRRLALADAVSASRRASDLARDQYSHGLVDQLVLLDAQRQLLSAESELTQSEGTVRTNVVALYKALGGGWQM